MSSPPRRWMPRVPKPLERLFDRFPLVTYEANKLPARAPTSDSLPTLFVFASEEDASRDAPSYNPTCLKWQVRFWFLVFGFVTPPSLGAPRQNYAWD